MNTKAFVLLGLFALAGCDQAAKETAHNAPQSTQAKGELKLADGSIFILNAAFKRSYEKPNSGGKLSMHEYSYSSIDKIAENDVYLHLQKAGYKRKVMSNENNVYKVHYYKKDTPVVGAVYTARDNDKVTVATLYWQEK
ncbi:hypothetical protein ACIQUF_16410 [Pseudomonas sp. NPDC090233]|uniref:hypothetical protein n=1 Tax=Pseudomonas sp. NPDC090233 TaxID=3364479 RepID=UPI00383B04C6